MHIELKSLSELQHDLLLAASNMPSLTRARGGYVAILGAKPFTTRTVFAMQRMGLLTLLQDGRRAALTQNGAQLLATGSVEVPEEQAG